VIEQPRGDAGGGQARLTPVAPRQVAAAGPSPRTWWSPPAVRNAHGCAFRTGFG